MTRIGISAVNSAGQSVFVEVGVDNGCTPIVRSLDSDGNGELDPVEVMVSDSLGISVRKRRNRVRVSVPNCGLQRLVMHVSCEETDGTSMIRFDITRGINLDPTSHGLIGESGFLPQVSHEIMSFPIVIYCWGWGRGRRKGEEERGR